MFFSSFDFSEREPEPEIEYYKGDQAYFPFQKGVMIDAKVDKETWSVGVIVKVEADKVWCGTVVCVMCIWDGSFCYNLRFLCQ